MSSNILSYIKEKKVFLHTIFGFLNSWGSRIGLIVGFVIRIFVRFIQKDDFDGNLFITILFIIICGLIGAIIGRIVIFIKKLIKSKRK